MTPIESNSVACREWTEATFMFTVQESLILDRVRELQHVRKFNLGQLVVWQVAQLEVVTSAPGYQLTPAAVERIEKIMARAESTEFGAFLKKSGIKYDHKIRWLIHKYARPTLMENI